MAYTFTVSWAVLFPQDTWTTQLDPHLNLCSCHSLFHQLHKLLQWSWFVCKLPTHDFHLSTVIQCLTILIPALCNLWSFCHFTKCQLMQNNWGRNFHFGNVTCLFPFWFAFSTSLFTHPLLPLVCSLLASLFFKPLYCSGSFVLASLFALISANVVSDIYGFQLWPFVWCKVVLRYPIKST